MIDLTSIVRLEEHRCMGCHRWWAAEGGYRGHAARCPHCVGEEAARLRVRISGLERSNAALRGALTRAKQREP